MGIAKMSKVFLLAHQAEKDQLLAVLQQSGSMEISNISIPNKENEAWAELVQADQEQDALAELETKLTEVRFSLDFLKRYYPEKKSLLDSLSAIKPKINADKLAFSVGKWAQESAAVYTALKQIDEKLMSLRNEETRLQNLKLQVTPWGELDIPLEEVKATESVHVELGTLPAIELEPLKNELKDTAVYLQKVSANGNDVMLSVAYHHDDATVVPEILKRYAFSKQVFPQLSGTPAELLQQFQADASRFQGERQRALAKTLEQVEYREALNYYYDYLTIERDKKQIVENFVRTENSFVLEGWVRTKDTKELTKLVEDRCDTAVVVIREPLPGEIFPVSLQNNKFFAPFEFVTTLYGLPSPTGLDPTPFFTSFWIVFFGLCMTDAGYGVVLAVLGGLGLLKIKSPGVRKLLWVLFAGGLSTVLFGWLVGGWFGAPILGAPIFFDALTNPMRMLIYALGLGVLQIFYGMAIKFISLSREGKYFDAVADVGLWFILIVGLGMLAVPTLADIGKILAIVGAGGLVLTQGRSQPTVIKKFFSGLLSLYNITGYLSDILSYSRLLALGLATGVIALAINTMAGLLRGHPIGFVVMIFLLIVGHTFNLIINTLGSFIHSSRLQYIEFYNRFYESGGIPFKPFKLKTHYVDVEPAWRENK